MCCDGDHQASSGYISYLQDPGQRSNDCCEGRPLVADATKRYQLIGEQTNAEMTSTGQETQ